VYIKNSMNTDDAYAYDSDGIYEEYFLFFMNIFSTSNIFSHPIVSTVIINLIFPPKKYRHY